MIARDVELLHEAEARGDAHEAVGEPLHDDALSRCT